MKTVSCFQSPNIHDNTVIPTRKRMFHHEAHRNHSKVFISHPRAETKQEVPLGQIRSRFCPRFALGQNHDISLQKHVVFILPHFIVDSMYEVRVPEVRTLTFGYCSFSRFSKAIGRKTSRSLKTKENSSLRWSESRFGGSGVKNKSRRDHRYVADRIETSWTCSNAKGKSESKFAL